MPDEAAKGFRCSASLDKAVAESAALCASTPIYHNTHAPQRSTILVSHKLAIMTHHSLHIRGFVGSGSGLRLG